VGQHLKSGPCTGARKMADNNVARPT